MLASMVSSGGAAVQSENATEPWDHPPHVAVPEPPRRPMHKTRAQCYSSLLSAAPVVILHRKDMKGGQNGGRPSFPRPDPSAASSPSRCAASTSCRQTWGPAAPPPQRERGA
jgi:hypothetical protein